MASRFTGPILGDGRAFGGGALDVPIQVVNGFDDVHYFNDFLQDSDYDATNDWTLTQVSGGGSAALVAAEVAGILRLDCPANLDGPIIQRDNVGSIQVPGATVVRAAMGARFRIVDVSAQAIFVGVAELNATSAVLTTPTARPTSDTFAGFHQITTDAGDLRFGISGAADTTRPADLSGFVALADNELVSIAIVLKGDGAGANQGAEGYVNGVKIGEVSLDATTSFWDANMFLTMANLGSGLGDDLDVDFIWMATSR